MPQRKMPKTQLKKRTQPLGMDAEALCTILARIIERIAQEKNATIKMGN